MPETFFNRRKLEEGHSRLRPCCCVSHISFLFACAKTYWCRHCSDCCIWCGQLYICWSRTMIIRWSHMTHVRHVKRNSVAVTFWFGTLRVPSLWQDKYRTQRTWLCPRDINIDCMFILCSSTSVGKVGVQTRVRVLIKWVSVPPLMVQLRIYSLVPLPPPPLQKVAVRAPRSPEITPVVRISLQQMFWTRSSAIAEGPRDALSVEFLLVIWNFRTIVPAYCRIRQ